jgi:methionine-rich copper-binding protein CopC
MQTRTAPRGHTSRTLAVAAALVLFFMTPAAVAADAELVSSTPADGALLSESPTEVVLTFNEAITDQSSFAVLDASGATVATGAVDPADPTTMRTALPSLPPGTYEVQWVARSADGHLPRGTFTFTVAEPTAPPATPTPAPSDEPTHATSPTATLTPAPTVSPTPTGDGTSGGDGATDALLPIAVVGLLIGGGLAYFLRRRSAA